MSRRLGPAAALLAATVACFAAAPTMNLGTLNLGVTLLSYLAIAQAWNLLAGYSGQISLGASAFVATGGYTTALLLAHTGISWPLAFAGAAIGAAALAALLAVPLLRLRGDYFAVGTLAISIAIQALISNWPWAGGASGITLPVSAVPSGGKLFQLAVLVAAGAMAAALYVKQSAFGLRLAAIRDYEPAAAGLGVSVYRHRLAALLPSSAITGLAGAVIAFQFIVISPDGVASVSWSLNAVLMTVVGGTGTVMGPVIGVAIVYYGLTWELQNQQVFSQVIEGILLIVVVRFAPRGVWPLLCTGVRRLPGLRPAAEATRPDPAQEAPAADDEMSRDLV
jgi:branched-chain amino acid transport system permease protein